MLLLSTPAVAGAYQTFLAARVHAVRLDACAAYPEQMVRTNTGRLVQPGHHALLERVERKFMTTHLGAVFENEGAKPLTDVQITYTPRDRAGHPLAYYKADWSGHFVPHARYDFNERGFKSIGPAPPKTASISCTVTSARVADGTAQERGER